MRNPLHFKIPDFYTGLWSDDWDCWSDLHSRVSTGDQDLTVS